MQFILDLAARVEHHEQRLARLEAQARQDSRTSSKPPSSDPPKTRAQRRAEARAKAKELMRREGERRAAGGQPGHRGAGRELRPDDQLDEIVDHYPEGCGGCGRRFASEQRTPSRRFGRHQVCELPPISVSWIEHRTHQLRCRHCRARTSAPVPEQIGACAFGPRLQAAVVTLTARHRISRRGISELARDLFGVTLSTGSADAICQRASEALAGPHLQLQDWVLDQSAVHVDETGWRTSGEGRALWTATTAGAAFFQIAEHCNREQFYALIGPYPGIVVSDRWNGYSHLDPNQRQVCWSHLQRDFRRHADGLGEQKTFGEQGFPLTNQVPAHQPGVRRLARLPARAPRPQPTPGRDRTGPDRTPNAARRRHPPRTAVTAGTASSPTTFSRSGPRSGPSPPSTAWNRPTTPPNARSAALSFTENSRSAPKATPANGSPNAPSPPPSPAACNTARYSPTSANSSPRTTAATRSPRSPEPGD